MSVVLAEACGSSDRGTPRGLVGVEEITRGAQSLSDVVPAELSVGNSKSMDAAVCRWGSKTTAEIFTYCVICRCNTLLRIIDRTLLCVSDLGRSV